MVWARHIEICCSRFNREIWRQANKPGGKLRGERWVLSSPWQWFLLHQACAWPLQVKKGRLDSSQQRSARLVLFLPLYHLQWRPSLSLSLSLQIFQQLRKRMFARIISSARKTDRRENPTRVLGIRMAVRSSKLICAFTIRRKNTIRARYYPDHPPNYDGKLAGIPSPWERCDESSVLLTCAELLLPSTMWTKRRRTTTSFRSFSLASCKTKAFVLSLLQDIVVVLRCHSLLLLFPSFCAFCERSPLPFGCRIWQSLEMDGGWRQRRPRKWAIDLRRCNSNAFFWYTYNKALLEEHHRMYDGLPAATAVVVLPTWTSIFCCYCSSSSEHGERCCCWRSAI